MSRPLVSVCMGTAQSDYPFLHRRESVYDLLRLSLANQTYEGPIEVVVADTMTERLQRESEQPWARVERVVLTKQVHHDRIAISAARNTAGVYARGELLIFVDDGIELMSHFVAAAVELHTAGRVPTRVLFELGARDGGGGVVHADLNWRARGCPTDLRTWPVVGHAGGVFVIAREVFFKLNGFDENFDGNWGCEDIEFCARLDRMKLSRVGRADLAVLRLPHHNTPVRETLRRCREAYAQWAYRSSRIEVNRRLSDAVMKELATMRSCTALTRSPVTCALCMASDRRQQVETYRTIPAEFDLRALHATYSPRPSGVYLDPWR